MQAPYLSQVIQNYSLGIKHARTFILHYHTFIDGKPPLHCSLAMGENDDFKNHLTEDGFVCPGSFPKLLQG